MKMEDATLAKNKYDGSYRKKTHKMLSFKGCFLLCGFIILSDRAFTGCLAMEQFVRTPEKNSYADLGSEFLFNWTYVGPDSDIDIIKWYPSDAVGTALGQLTMKYIGGSTLRVFNPRASHISNAVMLLKNISFADEGYFACDIAYINGRAIRDTIFLHVTIAPNLVRQLSNTTIVLINTQASWTCEFTSRPAPTVKWYRDGMEMISGSRYNISTMTIGVVRNATKVSTTLTINSTQPEDTGVIKCSAILPNHVISSSTHNIVYHAPRNTYFSSNILNVGALGERTIFTCLAQGNPQVSYQTYKNGVLLSNLTSSTFVIVSTQFADTGLYSCIPVNYLGQGPQVDYNFIVYVSPKLQSQSPASIETYHGSYVIIYCAFSGLPAPNITWQKVNGNISSAVNISFTTTTANGSYPVVNSTMVFNRIDKDEHGVYKCIAVNPAGSPSAKISINVTYTTSSRIHIVSITQTPITNTQSTFRKVKPTSSFVINDLTASSFHEVRNSQTPIIITQATFGATQSTKSIIINDATYKSFLGGSNTHVAGINTQTILGTMQPTQSVIIYDVASSIFHGVSNTHAASINTKTILGTTQPTTSVIIYGCNQGSSDEWKSRDSAFVAVIVILIIIIIIMATLNIMQRRKLDAGNHLKESRRPDLGQGEMHYMDLGTASREAETTYAQLQSEYEEIGQKNPKYANA